MRFEEADERGWFDLCCPLSLVSLSQLMLKFVLTEGASNASGEFVGGCYTCQVSHVDATVRHLLGRRDAYFRFNPTAEVFGCALGDTQQATLDSLSTTAKRYMDRQVRGRRGARAREIGTPRGAGSQGSWCSRSNSLPADGSVSRRYGPIAISPRKLLSLSRPPMLTDATCSAGRGGGGCLSAARGDGANGGAAGAGHRGACGVGAAR